jgi:hypothetical protein
MRPASFRHGGRQAALVVVWFSLAFRPITVSPGY